MSDDTDRPIASLADALRDGRRRLSLASSQSPGLDAEVLLRHVLGIDRTALFSRLAESIAPEVLAHYRRLLQERAGGTPVAYITREREFLGLPFLVSPEVLIPRPETELLVEWASDWLRGRASAAVVDVGTGSGAIALSLARTMEADWSGRVVAADVSTAALAIAARNRERFGRDRSVSLVQGSLLEWLGGRVDLVLANLPYLRPDQIAENPELAAEPPLALDGGSDGLALIRRLVLDTPRVLAPGGALGIEIDPNQRAEVVSLAEQAFPEAEISVLRDLAGLDRHVVVTRRDTSSGRRAIGFPSATMRTGIV
jgi:release factor glutamine methyltransferase